MERIEFSEKLGEALCGLRNIDGRLETCIELINEEHCTDFTKDDIDWDALGNITFECAECGWWCEACDWHESDDGDICGDCQLLLE